ncbi:MAG: hypothetical protein U1F49_17845 [Rubrivivax sp.]
MTKTHPVGTDLDISARVREDILRGARLRQPRDDRRARRALRRQPDAGARGAASAARRGLAETTDSGRASIRSIDRKFVNSTSTSAACSKR